MSQSNSTPATIMHPFDIAETRSPMTLALLVVAAVMLDFGATATRNWLPGSDWRCR
jgi:hypothetical protein